MYLSKRCRIVSLALSIIVSAGAFGAEEDSALLKRAYHEGAEYYVEINRVMQQTFISAFLGPLTKTDFRQLTGVMEKTVSVSESGEAKLELTFDRVAQRVSAMQDLWRYDSDGGAHDMLLKRVMAPLIGKRVTLRIDAAGKPIALEGMLPIVEEMEMGSLDDPASAQFFGQIKEELADAPQRFLWADMSLGLLPNRKVQVGETWNVTVRQPMVYIGAVLREYTCTLEALEENNGRPVARISYQAKCKVAPDAESTLSASGLPMEYLGGTVTGTMLFDMTLSIIVYQDEQLEATQATEMPIPEKPEVVQQLTVEQTARVVMRRLELAQRAEQKKRHVQGARPRRNQPPPKPAPSATPGDPQR